MRIKMAKNTFFENTKRKAFVGHPMTRIPITTVPQTLSLDP